MKNAPQVYLRRALFSVRDEAQICRTAPLAALVASMA